MRCYFEGKVKTNADTISVDFIEVVKNGKIIVLDWDESEIGFDDCDEKGYKIFSGRLKGIKFDDVYANKRINEVRGAELSAVQFFISDDEAKNPILTNMQLDDEGVLYDFDTGNDEVEYTIVEE